MVESHLELNVYLSKISIWNAEEIKKRGKALSERVLAIFPSFGDASQIVDTSIEVTGSVPSMIEYKEKPFKVENWREVLLKTINAIIEENPDNFEILNTNFPNYFSKDSNRFNTGRKLNNGFYIEVNRSAQNQYGICLQFIEALKLTPKKDWIVYYE